MLLEQILFFVAAAGAIGGALGVVLLRNPFFSVLALVAHLVALALLFLLLRAEFVAAAQLVVYAGAVMVLYVFVVAYIGGVEETVGGEGLIGRTGPVFAGALLAELTMRLSQFLLQRADLLAVLPDLQIVLLEVLVDLVLVVAAHDLGEVAGRGVFEEVAELSVDFRLHVA